MITILEATGNKAGVICEIAENTWWQAYGKILPEGQIAYMLEKIYNKESIKQQIENGSQKYLLLFDDEKPVGFASFAPRMESPETYKLHKLYCLPVGQKKGYGKMLLKEVERRTTLAGVNILELNVNGNNTARGFYEKMGFKVAYEEDIPIGPFWMNDFVMRKHL